jgi:hypothetical protein
MCSPCLCSKRNQNAMMSMSMLSVGKHIAGRRYSITAEQLYSERVIPHQCAPSVTLCKIHTMTVDLVRSCMAGVLCAPSFIV